MILVKTRQKDGKTEYLCPTCEVYDLGRLINVTGYTEVVCSCCDMTLANDYFDLMDNEIQRINEYEMWGGPRPFEWPPAGW